MPTWDEIEELIVHGDTAAALELLARKTDYFCTVANSICQDGAMAEDTVQKFFQEKLLEQNILVGYDPEKSRLKTWLYRIVYNLAIAEIRDPDRKGTGSLSDDETPEPAARSEEPVKQALSEDIRYMSICYPLLKGKEARALILTAALWPTADIARELKIREVTVRYYRLKWRRTIAGTKKGGREPACEIQDNGGAGSHVACALGRGEVFAGPHRTKAQEPGTDTRGHRPAV